MTRLLARSLAAALLASVAVPSLAWAQDIAAQAAAVTQAATPATIDAQATANVDQLVVTGQRGVQATVVAAEAVKFGNAVQVVNAEEIRFTGATNFAELAQFLVKGVNVGYSPDEGEFTIRLDGGGDRDTLVIRDGVPLYDRGPALEDIWGATTIDPHMIQNMEVFRGGNSLFFGSNGGIGVVSIVSKKPDGTLKGEFGGSYGSFNTRELWGNFSMPIDADGRHSFMVYGSMLATDSPRIFNPDLFVDNVKAAGGTQKYPLNRNEVGVKYLWKIDDTAELRLSAEYTESWFQDAFPDTEIFSPNTVRYPIFDASFEKRWSDMLHTEVQGYFSNPKLWNTELLPDICKVRTGCANNPATGAPVKFGDWTGLVYPNGPYRGFGDSNQKKSGFQEYGLTMRNTVDLHEYLQFVAGFQRVTYKDDSDPAYPVKDDPATTTGLFIDVRPTLPFSPDTALSFAVRHDFLPGSESRTIWKFGARQPLPGGFYVRGNGGTSYSLPRNTEMFVDTSTTLGNPDLQTEETKTFNGAIGFQREFDDWQLALEVGGFKTEITNRIQGTSDFRVPPSGTNGPRNTFINSDALTKIDGLTVDLNVTVGRAWRLNLGYTAQDARPDSGLLKGEQINETPAWFITGGLEWTSPDQRFVVSVNPRIQGGEWVRGGLSVGGIGKDRINFGNYAVVNATLNYFLGDDRQHHFQLRIVNLTDEKYAERYGFANQRFGSAFNRGEFTTTDPRYFFSYPFEGKPRSFFASYSYNF
jgi:iron complex outermembrane receptor protein